MILNRMTCLSLLVLAFALFLGFGKANAQDCTFTNPIKGGNAPDPHVVYKDGYYIGCYTTGGDIRIWRNQNLENIFHGESRSVWNQGNDIWAPEIHYLNGKWYVYSTRNTGSWWMNTFILESNTQDPLGAYTLVATLPQLGNTLDANVWQDPSNGQIYMAYSRLDAQMGEGQENWLTKMSNPYTPEGTPVLLSYPQHNWEKEYGAVNEGPAFLVKGDKVHIVYSASQTHYEGYKLGRLTATLGSDLMNRASWTKHPEPVFQKSVANGVYAPGHHSTLKTPGGEWWIIYHGKYHNNRNTVGAARDARMQRFSFDPNNNPVFGEPVAAGVARTCPDTEAFQGDATYDFDDGTLQGWKDLTPPNSNIGPRNWTISPPAFPGVAHSGSGAIGQNIEGGGNQDSSHPTLWLRSPEFGLDTSGDLGVWLRGGTGSGSLTGMLTGNVPPNSSNPGFQGVALRNANTETFVLFGSKKNNGDHWEQVVFTASELASLDQNAVYTLDLIDAGHGGWGWVAMDSVTIPDTFSLDEPASPPTISSISDQTIPVNTTTGPLSFTLGHAGLDPGQLQVSGSSSNIILVPTENIVFGGSAAERNVTVMPAAEQAGRATITVAVDDGSQSSSASFNLVVLSGDEPEVDLVVNPGGNPPANFFLARAWHWDTDGDTEGWVAGGNGHLALEPGSPFGGHIIGTSTNVDPQWFSPGNLGIPATEELIIEFRLRKKSADGTRMDLFWHDSTGNFGEGRLLSIPADALPRDGEFHVVRIHFSNTIQGILSRIRFDPISGTPGIGMSFDLDYLRIYTTTSGESSVSPTLAIERWGETQVRLSWPSAIVGWTLQSSAEPGGAYSDAGLEVTVKGDENSAYDTLISARHFYRLTLF